jgi:pilus assembly protein CpaC
MRIQTLSVPVLAAVIVGLLAPAAGAQTPLVAPLPTHPVHRFAPAHHKAWHARLHRARAVLRPPALPVAHPAIALTAQTETAPATLAHLIVEVGSGRVITLPGPVANVFVADPKIAEVRPASPTSLFMFGITAGHTTVAALDAAGHPVRQYEVTVRPSSFGASEAAGAIVRGTPGAAVKLEADPKRLLLKGEVATPADAAAAAAAAAGFAADGQTIDNQLNVKQQIQVGLHVRIAEMSRNITRNLGINWQALGEIGTIGKLVALSGTSGLNSGAATLACAAGGIVSSGGCKGLGFTGVIDALAQDNLIHVLAEPNLTAMSGETASFLVGGEFPVPVAQGGTSNAISVEFKQYGIGLSFVPTVFSDDRIRLHVRPEVSQLSTIGAVTINGITIPSLTVRRADTTVEVGSGQSFAIAGLLSDQTNQTGNAIPGLGEVPILGALFRSDAFQRNETELVIIVTPYIVRPVSNPVALRAPTDGFKAPNDIERLLLMRQIGRGAPGIPPRVPGQAGFVIQ